MNLNYFNRHPWLLLVVVQCALATYNLLSRILLNQGMQPLDLALFRQIITTFGCLPFVWRQERSLLLKITWRSLGMIFLIALSGPMIEPLHYVGVKFSTAQTASAMGSLILPIKFLLPIIIRGDWRTVFSINRIIGLLMNIVGGFMIPFYTGPRKALSKQLGKNWASNVRGKTAFFGPLLMFLSTSTYSVSMFIQECLEERFPAPFTIQMLSCIMTIVVLVPFKIYVVPHHSDLSVVEIITLTYVGLFCAPSAKIVTSRCIRRRGLLYVSYFTPLSMVLTAITSVLFLDESVGLGTFGGAFLIFVGPVLILWNLDPALSQNEGTEVDVVTVGSSEEVVNGGDSNSDMESGTTAGEDDGVHTSLSQDERTEVDVVTAGSGEDSDSIMDSTMWPAFAIDPHRIELGGDEHAEAWGVGGRGTLVKLGGLAFVAVLFCFSPWLAMVVIGMSLILIRYFRR